MDAAASTLTITAQVYDAPFVAVFEGFDAEIIFDPDELTKAKVVAEIRPATFAATNPDDALFASEAQGVDWFNSANFPEIIFQSEAFTSVEEGAYLVSGDLMIKGQRFPLSFPFALEINDGQAQMRAYFNLNRLDLGLGGLTHPLTNTVGGVVEVSLTIFADKI